MYTPEFYQAMDDDEAQHEFKKLCESYYGHSKWKPSLARDVAMTGNGIANWFRERSRPPYWAILLITTRSQLKQARSAAAEVTKGLTALSQLYDPARD